jgi:hypothetical protein
MTLKNKGQPVDRADQDIDLSETRKGLDIMDVVPPHPGLELVNQPAAGAADANNSQDTPQRASTSQPPADYAD